MYTTADFLNRTVLSVAEGKNWGTVISCDFDMKLQKLTRFIVSKFGEDYHSVPASAIFKKENDAVVFGDASEFEQLSGGAPLKLSRLTIYGASGMLIDAVKEVFFDEKFRVHKIQGETRDFLPKEIISSSADTVIIKDCKLPREKSAVPHPAPGKKMQVSKNPKTPRDIEATPAGPKIIMPCVSTGNFGFLVGRRADKNILSMNNEIIIRKGAVITRDTVKQARLSGKLLELSLHAVK